MKINPVFFIITLAGFLVIGSPAQGTLEFRATLSYVGTPDSVAGSAQFVLNGNAFSGTSFFEPPNQFTFIRIENLNHSTQFPATRVQDLAPINMVQADWDSIQLNSSQITELLDGNWLINIGSVEVPEGAIRGELQLIPEPSASVLIGFGSLALVLFCRKCRT